MASLIIRANEAYCKPSTLPQPSQKSQGGGTPMCTGTQAGFPLLTVRCQIQISQGRAQGRRLPEMALVIEKRPITGRCHFRFELCRTAENSCLAVTVPPKQAT